MIGYGPDERPILLNQHACHTLFLAQELTFGILFRGPRSNTPNTSPKRTSKMADTGKREDPSSIPGDGIPFFSFFFFFHPPPFCLMLEESSSVLYFVIQDQIAPKLAQNENPRWRTQASERTRVRSLVMAFLFSLFSFSFTHHLYVRC